MSSPISRGRAEGSRRPGAVPRSPLADAERDRAFARLAAAVAAGDEAAAEDAGRSLAGRVARQAAEEVVLQTYLFAGFPAAINGFLALERVWPPAIESRTTAASSRAEAAVDGGETDGTVRVEAAADDSAGWEAWRARGERLCRRVYGVSYPRLRARLRELSPPLDEWVVVEGYGKTLSRPGLSETARELCAVAALAALGAARQLEAHLEGARRLGVDDGLLREAVGEAIRRHVPPARRSALEVLLEPRGER